MTESNPNPVDHTVLTDKDFTSGEVAYRRRQAKGQLGRGERILVALGAGLVLAVAGQLLWGWLT